MSSQLPLNVRLRDSASLENFYPARNAEAFSQVTVVARGGATVKLLYLWGGPGTGKSHLLQAVSHAAQQQGATPFYLPLQDLAELQPSVLEDLDQASVVCLDDIHTLAAQATWETALFNLYEQCRQTQTALIVSANAAPAHLGFKLADLVTRLGSGLVYPLHALNDAEKLAALQWRARQRGLQLSHEVAQYVLHHYPRNMQVLFDLLERLDQASLVAQRQITIPFLRSLEAQDSNQD